MSNKTTVFVAMSGGVDSSVTAALLKEQGFDVVGVFMRNWSNDDFGFCTWEEDQRDMRMVCDQLDIPYYTFDFEEEYKNRVIDYFFKEYEKGRTPNPDILCNNLIKFDLFRKKAKKLGADKIATGHYAGIEREGEGVKLLRGKDPKKDQSYFLYRLTKEQLRDTLFPLGELTKEEVREKAKGLDLPVADKPDSQGICFIGDIDVQEFIKTRLPAEEGPIKDLHTDEKIGEHEGAHLYTIGQRHALGLSGQDEPLYVVETDVESNTVWVAPEEFLYESEIALEDWHWTSDVGVTDPAELNREVEAKIRHSPKTYAGRLSTRHPELDSGSHSREGEGSELVFKFNEPVRALAPGQSLVVYDDDVLLGGAVMTKKKSKVKELTKPKAN